MGILSELWTGLTPQLKCLYTSVQFEPHVDVEKIKFQIKFLNSFITLRVATVEAGFNSPTHIYAAVQFEPHVNLETSQCEFTEASLCDK